jgi:hypothetical protein
VIRVGIETKNGQELDKQFNPAGLPFFIFSPEVKQAYNFNSIESGLVIRKDGLFFKDNITRINYFHKRERIPGRIELFVDPFFPGTGKILEYALRDSLKARHIVIHPMINSDPSNGQLEIEEKFRQEEALRWLVLERDYGKQYPMYLTLFSANPSGSYWFKQLSSLGITVDQFVGKIESSKEMLTSCWKELDSLRIRGPVTLVYENREVITAGNEREFEAILLDLLKKK